MNKELNIPLFDMVMCLSDAMDLVSPAVTGHHKRVAYIASSIANELGLSREREKDLIIAGALHDAGAFSLSERIDNLNWDVNHKMWDEIEIFEANSLHQYVGSVSHAELGYFLIKEFAPFANVASLVRYHHHVWNEGQGAEYNGKKISLGSHILHLADEVDRLINRDEEILGQSERICNRIREESNKKFVPELVEVFIDLAQREDFWFNILSTTITRILARRVEGINIQLDQGSLMSLARIFSRIIDFRSRFTATHSSGVAASAEALSSLVGLSDAKSHEIKIAGYLHDIGKLAVPPEILNKDTKLTRKEFNIIKKHPYYTYQILDRVEGLEKIKIWASFHHERLDGTGYPFHRKAQALPIESRIMAVADVFTAITEDRPYRGGMNISEALQVLERMTQDSALDSDIFAILKDHSKEIDETRIVAQNRKIEEYKVFWKQVGFNI